MKATVYTSWNNNEIGTIKAKDLDGIKRQASRLCNEYSNVRDTFIVWYEENRCQTFHRDNKKYVNGEIVRGYWY